MSDGASPPQVLGRVMFNTRDGDPNMWDQKRTLANTPTWAKPTFS